MVKKKAKPKKVVKKKIKQKPKAKKKIKVKPKAKVKVKSKLKLKTKSKLKAKSMARLLLPLGKVKDIFKTRYGFFLYDGSEFVINTPETPAPWSNMLTNGDYGMSISQSGCGMSFQGGIGNKITRWQQDTNSENFGKFIYIRDNQTQDFWSATWKPVCKPHEFYEVRHGIGYTNISSKNNGIITSLIYYVAADESVEIWQMRIRNVSDQERYLSIFSYLEWDFGTPTGNREYDKLFVDTSYDESLSAIFAKTYNDEYAFHSANHKVQTFTCGRDFFLGAYKDASKPRCVEKGMCFGEQGRYNDPAAALQIEIELPPNGEKELFFTVGKTATKKEADKIIKKYKNVKVVEEEFSRACHRWSIRLNGFHITTPDEGANILTNKWFRYQAMSAGLASFGSCYDPAGKVSFKDYIINGLILLTVNPKYHRQLLLDCAQKQFENGCVLDNWDPKTLKGVASESIETPLWLVYSLCEYIKETQDLSALNEEIKCQDTSKKTLFTHCKKAVDRAIESTSKKGLPLLIEGDHISSIDATDNDARAESIWLGEFIVYILREFIPICALMKDKALVADYELNLKKLKEKLKKLGFDDDRYLQAISRTGKGIGTSKGKNERLFLDAQTWAVLSGLCEENEAKIIMDNVKANLYKDHGPVMLFPSYDQQEDGVGTLTKLPPGVMENGGISVESACWSIWAETKLGRANNAWSIYSKLDPVDRSHKSDIYKLEPFVSCAHVDGPDSQTNGRARASWYNRSAYWMVKVMIENILGIRPTSKGLLIDPCIPNRWGLFKVRRSFRNAYYTIEVTNPRFVSQGIAEITVDGEKMTSNVIPAYADDKRHLVKVVMGKPKK